MRRNNRRLFRAARGIIGTDWEAKEVVQDAWPLKQPLKRASRLLKRIQRTHRNKRIRLFFQDEARIGPKASLISGEPESPLTGAHPRVSRSTGPQVQTNSRTVGTTASMEHVCSFS